MLACDCWFYRTHQEGVTAKELADIEKRAKTLMVTHLSYIGEIRLFLVKGGEAEHYVTAYPGGDGLGNCKHCIAVRSFLEKENDKERVVSEIVGVEDGGEADETSLFTGVSAVG